MVDRAELEAIADEMARNGESPSIRTVRGRLPGGGSHRVIGLMLADWRAKREASPRPAKDEFPAALKNKLEAFAIEIWRHGLAAGESERRRLAGRVDALERSFVEAVARADAFAERLANSGSDAEAGAQASKLSRAEAGPLWADVMREIDGLLAGGNRLTPGEIINRLDPETLRKVAHELTGAAKEARLAYKMRERKLKGAPRFVEVDGRFALAGESPHPAPDGDASGAKPRRRRSPRDGDRGEDRQE